MMRRVAWLVASCIGLVAAAGSAADFPQVAAVERQPLAAACRRLEPRRWPPATSSKPASRLPPRARTAG